MILLLLERGGGSGQQVHGILRRLAQCFKEGSRRGGSGFVFHNSSSSTGDEEYETILQSGVLIADLELESHKQGTKQLGKEYEDKFNYLVIRII